MKIGMLRSGAVAKSLAAGFLGHGYRVMLGTRQPAKLEEWAAPHPEASIGTLAEAAADALRAAGAQNFEGKTIIDTTNPIADALPVNGVLKFFTTLDDSLMERLQREFPLARFVKAFSFVGSASMVNPQFKSGKPTMFICGNDEAAKATVTGILDHFGWETADMGKAEAARAIEPLCILWCIPGFLRQDWVHAFKLLT